jgi:hypothetical protein
MIYVILNIVSVLFIHQRMVVRGNHLERLVGMICCRSGTRMKKSILLRKGGDGGSPPAVTTQAQHKTATGAIATATAIEP